MKFNLKAPCADCPFRSDIAFYLTKDRRIEIANDLQHDKTFACHKTVNYERWGEDPDVPYTQQGEESHCYGALVALHKSADVRSNFLLRLAIHFGWLKVNDIDITLPVSGLAEWVNLEDI